MIQIKAKFNGGVFIPEKTPRIPEGQTVYLAIHRVPRKIEDENPSPSGDSYFLNPDNVRKILDSAAEMRRGEGKAFTSEQLDALMGL